MIEEDHVDGAKNCRANRSFSQKADVIMLGCTHYHWIEHQIRILSAGKAKGYAAGKTRARTAQTGKIAKLPA